MVTKQRVRMKHIAEQAGVAVSTVSMALADSPQISAATKEKIHRLCQESGYRTAGSSPTIPLSLERVAFVGVGASVAEEGLAEILAGVTQVAAERDIRLELSTLELGEGLFDEIAALAAGVDGLLLCGPLDVELLNRIAEAGINAVILGDYLHDSQLPNTIPQLPVVASDCQGMGRSAVERLLAEGHERIAFVAEKLYPGMYASEWRDGYLLGLSAAGHAIDDDLIHISGETYSGAGAAAAHLASLENPPTAFVVPDARLAGSLRTEMRLLGQEVTPEVLTTSGTVAIAARYELAGCPRLLENSAVMMAVALDLLQFRRNPDNQTPSRCIHRIPFLYEELRSMRTCIPTVHP
ncbi:MAG: LacI family DNA-binding transcriptional regulator [Planctomycetota bacterium]|jgi:DNA-binding LacI/PurR family transcriptional regulator